MKKKKAIVISALVLIALLAAAFFWRWSRAAPRKPDPLPQGDYSYTIEYTEHKIDRLMKQHHLPSVGVSLIDDQDIVWQAAFGQANLEREIPAQVDTVYKVWSVAKVFTALETMRLVEDGLIDLDAPITETLPGFSIQSRFPESDPITVRSILAHHSGLPRNECHSTAYVPPGGNVLETEVVSLRDCHVVFPVGYRYSYSNVGPDLLGHLIQELRGKGFAQAVEENLLSPIGMVNSAFLSTDLPSHVEIAPGYEYYKREYYAREQGDIASHPRGNFYTTVEDMGEFAKFVFRGGTAQGEQLVRSETLELMFEDQYPGQRDPMPMGLGWKTARVLGSERMVWHDGGPEDGTGALIALLPERKLGVVLLSNSTSFEAPLSMSLARDILALMLETKYGIVPPQAESRAPLDLTPTQLDEYVGRYITFGEVMDVSLRRGRLKAKVIGMTLDLVPVDENRFRVSHWLLKLGLADLLQLPPGLQELELEFLVGDPDDEDLLIVKVGGFLGEVCPRYPEYAEPPALWQELAGEYELRARLSSDRFGPESIGRVEIQINEGVLTIPGIVGPVRPINETTIVIQSGPFAGETIAREPDTGVLYHQWVVYMPIQGE